VCAEIDDKVKAFLDPPFEGDWYSGSMHLVKVREAGRIVMVAVIVAVGVNSHGRREVLVMDIGPSEARTFWTTILCKLARRSLRGVKLVTSDAHEVLKRRSPRCSLASWQRCCVHFMRNAQVHAG
jgi:putative transposase